jgi:hypothetical protein
MQESQDIQDHGLNNAAPRVKKGGVKRVTQRGKAFSKEEDKMICFAFLNVSKDAVTGNSLFSIPTVLRCQYLSMKSFVCYGRNKPI